jgi:hypothetical protein
MLLLQEVLRSVDWINWQATRLQGGDLDVGRRSKKSSIVDGGGDCPMAVV